MYDYRVVSVAKVVDGDTVDAVIDVGFRLTTYQRLRVVGIDTPERGEPGWDEATLVTKRWLEGRELRVRTTKADSFGRYLGDLYDRDSGESLTDALLAAGYAPYA